LIVGCVVVIDSAVLCDVQVARMRRLIGIVTLLALVAIFVGVTGMELSLPRPGSGSGSSEQRGPLPGVRAIGASLLVRVGVGAPAGGELAFMAVEPGGNLVVTDARRHTVMRFDATGHLLSEWGPQLGDTTLVEPAGVAVQGDNFFVIDRGTPRIFRLDASGRLLATLGLESQGTYGLNGLAVDLGGNLFLADTGRNRIIVIAPGGQILRSVGRGGTDLGGLTQPMMVAFAPDGSFFVADWENNRIERWNAGFEATDAFSTGFHPFGVAIDQVGRVYAPDMEHRRIQVYTPQGSPLGEIGAAGSPPLDVGPKQLALSRSERPALYALGADGIVRLDLENTAPPPQGGPDIDVVSLAVILLVVLFLVFAVISRRGRRSASLARTALDGPVRLHAENGRQRQPQQPSADQDRLVANQTERKQ
jgi:DNA-binding beta-propeller fold protein YncE